MPIRVQLRRATCLFAYWRNGRLFFHNFARRLTVSARLNYWEVLAFFSEWRTSQEALIHFAGYTQRAYYLYAFSICEAGPAACEKLERGVAR